jgi:hypothetical protein
MCMHCTRRQFIEAGALAGLAVATGHLPAASGVADPSARPKGQGYA